MFIRSQLDKIIPIRDGESELSKDDKKVVFKGGYFRTTGIKSLEVWDNDKDLDYIPVGSSERATQRRI